jgi:hypothetical protein
MADRYYGGARPGSIDFSLPVRLVDTTTNLGKTGVAAGSVTAYYYRQGAAAAVSITVSALTNLNDAHADGGWKEVDATNMKGIYRFDVPDAAFATGADFVVISIQVTGAYEFQREYPLETRRSLRRGQAVNNYEFFMRDTANATAGKTGLSAFTAQVSKDGGAFGALTNSPSEISNGFYKINLAAADLDADQVTLRFAATGALDTFITLVLEPKGA